MTPSRLPSALSATLAAACLALAACGDDPPATANKTPPPQNDRERVVENSKAAGAVGYDGDALSRSVKRTIDNIDARNADAQQATQAAGQNAADKPAADR